MPTPTPDAATRVAEEPSTEAALAKRYHLILLDDNDHTYTYVVGMLGRIFGYEREKAYAIAGVVDSQGQAVVETAGYEQATRHQRMIHRNGADPRIERCRGSMSAIVEEAP